MILGVCHGEWSSAATPLIDAPRAILGAMSNSSEDEHPWRERVVEAALEAERQTGLEEETDEEARRHVLMRLGRAVLGFVIIGVGIAALPLPGPGWLIIILGLSLLPFAWAERTIRLIRQRIPGVPEEGKVPARTWVIMGVLVVATTAFSIMFGEALMTWANELWGDPDRLLG